ncbi:MAG TPA: hypothetical protein VHM48_09085 [Candidatus Limnocylindrales bacterium]|nr:hypothetical protein [Candidatus Limnocylindrales bacterium]
MQTDRLFRITAIAWLATAVARVALAAVQAGTPGPGVSPVAFAIGAGAGLLVAGLLWFRPGRGSAIAACAFGLFAVVGIAYLPFIGFQPWFIVLSLADLIAFVLSVVCLFATRRPGRSSDADRWA